MPFLLVLNNVFCRLAEIYIYYCFSGIYLVSVCFYPCEYFVGYAQEAVAAAVGWIRISFHSLVLTD